MCAGRTGERSGRGLFKAACLCCVSVSFLTTQIRNVAEEFRVSVLIFALMRAVAGSAKELCGGARGVEGALIGSLLSHQYVQVVGLGVLLGDPQRQHLLVQEESAQTLLAGLPLFLQLPLAQRLLLELPLLRTLLSGQRKRGAESERVREHRHPQPV